MSDRPDEDPAVPPGEADRPVAYEPPPIPAPAYPNTATPNTATPETAAPARRRASPLGAVALVLVLAEAGALAWVYTHPQLPPDLDDRLAALDQATHAAGATADGAAVATHGADGKLAALQRSVAALQDRPTPQPAPAAPAFDPKPLQDELDDVKSTLGQLKTDTANAVALAAAAQKAGQADSATTGGLTGRIDDNAAKLASLSSRLDDLATRLAAATGQLDKQASAVSTQTAALATLSSRFDQASNESRRIASLASGAERAARLQAASVALSIGRPTGAIPDAPPALARFGTEAPPTEASLILAFPDAAAATLKASEPQTAGQGFFKRLWTRAQSAVTVRDGARVIVGDPASGIVAAARERLAAGDLQGAVSTLGDLSGAAADAMDEWRSRAAALVDARAALASMMARQ